jgi:mitochondrial fission protein ELM1
MRKMLILGTSNTLQKKEVTKEISKEIQKYLEKIVKTTSKLPIAGFEMFINKKPKLASLLMKKYPNHPYLKIIAGFGGKVVSVDDKKLQKTEEKLIKHIYEGKKINNPSKLIEKNTHNVIKRSAAMYRNAEENKTDLVVVGFIHAQDIKKNVLGAKIKIVPDLEKISNIFGAKVVEEDIKKQVNLHLREELNRKGTYKRLFHLRS